MLPLPISSSSPPPRGHSTEQRRTRIDLSLLLPSLPPSSLQIWRKEKGNEDIEGKGRETPRDRSD